ncbi:hypothetical protein BpHYR1_033167 [Brachionus plicatilis]|uniref:Uncharacterized protein n=1 Tax=Brachionus plicatilis TaxID=10195 RepID=A0A3M7QMJ8_BRAPC|nr:hypothetical protein BpHYR1_033167 [Brachionus plicatilis]
MRLMHLNYSGDLTPSLAIKSFTTFFQKIVNDKIWTFFSSQRNGFASSNIFGDFTIFCIKKFRTHERKKISNICNELKKFHFLLKAFLVLRLEYRPILQFNFELNEIHFILHFFALER